MQDTKDFRFATTYQEEVAQKHIEISSNGSVNISSPNRQRKRDVESGKKIGEGDGGMLSALQLSDLQPMAGDESRNHTDLSALVPDTHRVVIGDDDLNSVNKDMKLVQ